MRQMVLNLVHLAAEVLARKARGHQFRDVSSSTPVLEAVKHESEVRALRHQIGQLPEEIGPAVLIDRNMLNVGKGDAGFPQAVGNRLRWEASPMLHAAEAFFFSRSNKLAVAEERSCGIAVEGIKPQNDHTQPSELVSADLSDGTERSCVFEKKLIGTGPLSAYAHRLGHRQLTIADAIKDIS